MNELQQNLYGNIKTKLRETIITTVAYFNTLVSEVEHRKESELDISRMIDVYFEEIFNCVENPDDYGYWRGNNE